MTKEDLIVWLITNGCNEHYRDIERQIDTFMDKEFKNYIASIENLHKKIDWQEKRIEDLEKLKMSKI